MRSPSRRLRDRSVNSESALKGIQVAVFDERLLCSTSLDFREPNSEVAPDYDMIDIMTCTVGSEGMGDF